MAVPAVLLATFAIAIGYAILIVPREKKEWAIEKKVLGCLLHAITVSCEKDGFLYTIAYEQMQERTALIFGIMLEDGSVHMPSDFIDERMGVWSEKLDPMPIPATLRISVYDLLSDHLCTIEIDTNTGAIALWDKPVNSKCLQMS